MLRPHKSRYWLNPKIGDPIEFRKRIAEICEVYQQSQELESQGAHVISCDEKTGMQALERIAPTKPSMPGKVERREYEYYRHGTLCLIGSFQVATGKIMHGTIEPTRTEKDFADHIRELVMTDLKAGWVFICDQLNTHKSESLVRLFIKLEGLDISSEELGAKGRAGILKNMKTRAKFLEDRSHRIRVLYTPKHCSWMNQIEIWFGILSAKVIRRGNFQSLEDLRTKVENFIAYWSKTRARPFKWTFKGFPLEA